MKGSLKLRPRRALNRSEAWACFTANLALPGSGSLAADRAVGYWQIAAGFLALIVTLAAMIPMIQWALSGGLAAAQSPMADPFENLLQLWRHARWPLAGMALYAGVTLWAAATSLAILANAPKEAIPPRIP